MNGKNITTGTIHNVKVERSGHLVQACGIRASQTASLVETTGEITCGKCLRSTPKAAPAPVAKIAKKTSGPAIWVILNSAGRMASFRTTRKEALAAAERIGGTVERRVA
jgi:hypothetical protein